MSKKNRRKYLSYLKNYWWVILLAFIPVVYFSEFPLVKTVSYTIAVLVGLFMFYPYIIQFFSPIVLLISGLYNHYRNADEMSFTRRYLYEPFSLISLSAFLLAQIVLGITLLVFSIVIWGSSIGFGLTVFLYFFFGLAPLGIISAPLVVFVSSGVFKGIGVLFFFLIAGLFGGFRKLVFSENYDRTAMDYMGISPKLYLLGALSIQVLALPIYYFDSLSFLSEPTKIFSTLIGLVLILLAAITSFKWLKRKKRGDLKRYRMHKPSVWLYIGGYLLTNVLYKRFEEFGVTTYVVSLLNIYFFVALLYRLFCFLKRKYKEYFGSDKQESDKDEVVEGELIDE